jgi:hypothetical protein
MRNTNQYRHQKTKQNKAISDTEEKTPLKTTFKQQKIDEIIEDFKRTNKLEKNNPIFNILDNTKNDPDQKAIALKGCLLKELSNLELLQESSELQTFFALQESDGANELMGLEKVSELLENQEFITQSSLKPEKIQELKEMISTINDIDKICRKAKFVGELGSIEIYEHISGIPGNEPLVQFQRKPSNAPAQKKPHDDHSLRHS